MQQGLVAPVRSIVVLRAGGLGDALFTLPALAALRAAYPDARLVVGTSEVLAPLLQGRIPGVDEVVALPPVPGVSAVPDVPDDPAVREHALQLLRDAAGGHVDLAVQLHGGGRYSNPFTSELGAQVTVGARDVDAPPLDRWVPYVLWQSEVARHLEVVGLVGAAPVRLDLALQLLDADHKAADEVLRAADVPDGAPLAVLSPGASDGHRRWPAASFAAVAHRLYAAGRCPVVIGTEMERELTAAVCADGPAVDLGGRLSLPELAGVLARADVVVGNDSGTIHLAAAVGTPTVGIYWCANVVSAGPPFRARHRRVIAWRLDCPRCGANMATGGCEHDEPLVADLPVDDVVGPALELAGGCPDAWR